MTCRLQGRDFCRPMASQGAMEPLLPGSSSQGHKHAIDTGKRMPEFVFRCLSMRLSPYVETPVLVSQFSTAFLPNLLAHGMLTLPQFNTHPLAMPCHQSESFGRDGGIVAATTQCANYRDHSPSTLQICLAGVKENCYPMMPHPQALHLHCKAICQEREVCPHYSRLPFHAFPRCWKANASCFATFMVTPSIQSRSLLPQSHWIILIHR
jgi:hypothetical protein